MVEGEWLAFNEILKRKTEAINAEVRPYKQYHVYTNSNLIPFLPSLRLPLTRTLFLVLVQIPSLQMKISAEGKLVDDKIRQFAEEWGVAKPISGIGLLLLYSLLTGEARSQETPSSPPRWRH